MIIQVVKIKSGLSDAEVARVMKERAPQFRALPGLVQKYYGYEKNTGEFTGIYLWDTEESISDFRQSELAQTIPAAYEAQGSPRIEFFEVLFQLRE
ncbi:MAG: YdhR family protein [Candidatus Thorarchaeota archaeon]